MAGEIAEPDERLAAFVADASIEDVPETAVRATERAFVDTVGVTLPGMAEPAAEAARSVFTDPGRTDGDASVLGSGARAPVGDAALVNATAAHALDFDDVTGNAWHPSVTLVPPALAVGERVDATGADLVTAFAVGFEAETYVAGFVQPGHYERGWHATGTVGVFGATAAAAVLLDLESDAARSGMNLAASLPAGLKKNFGTMTKPLHAGFAARNGVTAALLAAEGVTATQGAFGDDGGFCDLYSGTGEAEAPQGTRAALGDPWSLVAEGISVKRYPCCYYAHAGIAASQSLVSEHEIDTTVVERISVTISPAAADALQYADPRTGLEAKFSMEYAIAAAVARDRVELAAFADGAISDPTVQTVRERVDVTVDADMGYDTFETVVEIETGIGESYRHVQSEPPGTPSNPLSEAARREKFAAATAHAGNAVDAGQAYAALDSLRELDDLQSLLATLYPTDST